MFKLQIKTDNAAFSDYPNEEIARILREIADKIEDGLADGKARDINGNTVGQWSIGR